MAQPPTHQPQQALMNQYNEFRQQVHIKPPTSHKSQLPQELGGEEDLDMDAQLENVSPERGGSSLQVSLGDDYVQVAQTTPWKTVQIGEAHLLQYPTVTPDWMTLRKAKQQKGEKRRITP